MTQNSDPSADLASKTVIRFPNLSGAIVEVNSLRDVGPFGSPRLVFGARCTGCLDSSDRDNYLPSIVRPRDWAAKHSATCRALPRPETDAQ